MPLTKILKTKTSTLPAKSVHLSTVSLCSQTRTSTKENLAACTQARVQCPLSAARKDCTPEEVALSPASAADKRARTLTWKNSRLPGKRASIRLSWRDPAVAFAASPNTERSPSFFHEGYKFTTTFPNLKTKQGRTGLACATE